MATNTSVDIDASKGKDYTWSDSWAQETTWGKTTRWSTSCVNIYEAEFGEEFGITSKADAMRNYSVVLYLEVGEQYNWNRGRIWNEAYESWDTASANTYNLAVDELWVNKDYGGRSYGITRKDGINFNEKPIKSSSSTRYDSFGISELFRPSQRFTRSCVDSIKLTDYSGRKYSVTRKDSVKFAEEPKKTLSTIVHDAFVISELSKTSTHYKRGGSEKFGITDKYHSGTSPIKNESVALKDSVKRVYNRNDKEAFAIHESYWDNILFLIRAVETLTFAELNSKELSVSHAESMKVLDKVKNAAQAILKETIKAIDQEENETKKHASEAISTTDKRSVNFKAVETEPLKLLDSIGNELKTLLKDTFKATDKDINNYKKQATDSISASDKHNIGFKAVETEQINIIDKVDKVISYLLYDDIAVDDEFARDIIVLRKFVETLKAVDYRTTGFGGGYSEKIALKDKESKVLDTLSKENILTLDELKRSNIWKRDFSTDVAFSDSVMRKEWKRVKEDIASEDAFIRASQGILSDVLINDGSMTLEEFKKNIDSPNGFGTFSEFKVGEYEYEEALVRLQVLTTALQAEPTVSDMVIHVDIPDTDDKGTVEITDTSAPTRIYYNNPYYNAPEVNVVLIGGNTGDGVAVPNILTTDGKDDAGRYFEVELRNEQYQRVAGKISWLAKGY